MVAALRHVPAPALLGMSELLLQGIMAAAQLGLLRGALGRQRRRRLRCVARHLLLSRTLLLLLPHLGCLRHFPPLQLPTTKCIQLGDLPYALHMTLVDFSLLLGCKCTLGERTFLRWQREPH